MSTHILRGPPEQNGISLFLLPSASRGAGAVEGIEIINDAGYTSGLIFINMTAANAAFVLTNMDLWNPVDDTYDETNAYAFGVILSNAIANDVQAISHNYVGSVGEAAAIHGDYFGAVVTGLWTAMLPHRFQLRPVQTGVGPTAYSIGAQFWR